MAGLTGDNFNLNGTSKNIVKFGNVDFGGLHTNDGNQNSEAIDGDGINIKNEIDYLKKDIVRRTRTGGSCKSEAGGYEKDYSDDRGEGGGAACVAGSDNVGSRFTEASANSAIILGPQYGIDVGAG